MSSSLSRCSARAAEVRSSHERRASSSWTGVGHDEDNVPTNAAGDDRQHGQQRASGAGVGAGIQTTARGARLTIPEMLLALGAPSTNRFGHGLRRRTAPAQNAGSPHSSRLWTAQSNINADGFLGVEMPGDWAIRWESQFGGSACAVLSQGVVNLPCALLLEGSLGGWAITGTASAPPIF